MNRITGTLLLSAFMFPLVSCSKEVSASQNTYPLTAFAVKVGNSYYHAIIDQEARTAKIGAIENTGTITDVTYTLKDGKATISPEPSSLIGKWKAEQSFTVTTSDGKTTEYDLMFTDYVDEYANVLFMDNFDVDGTPDATKWALCRKQGSDWNEEMSESYDQAYIEDGKLILKAELVDGVHKAGGIQTSGLFDFTFGKVEVRARITRYPNGAFPAIWMMPKKAVYSGWPDCGEIDIMEHIKQESCIYHTIHTNYTYNLGIKNPPNSTNPVCGFSNWVTYGLEWTAESLAFYIDGVQTFSYSNLHLEDEAEKKQWPFTKDSSFYLILNMGLGRADGSTWAGAIDDAALPAIMEVDWVKVSRPD